MLLDTPKELSALRRFFLEPASPRQRQYEALRAYFVEGRPAPEVARAFGYSVGALHVLAHHFRRDPAPAFFLTPRRGPQSQPKKSAARDLIVRLRKQNHSVCRREFKRRLGVGAKGDCIRGRIFRGRRTSGSPVASEAR